MSDEEIQELINRPKIIKKKDTSKLLCSDDNLDGASWRLNVKIESTGEDVFHLRGRLSVDDPTDFSAILSVETTNGSDFILIRCNGYHEHHNYLERTRIRGMHIHRATERYAACQRKDEGFAEPTNEYANFSEAVGHLMKLANIQIEGDKDQIPMFGFI